MALESVRISEKITLYQDTFHCIIQFQGLKLSSTCNRGETGRYML